MKKYLPMANQSRRAIAATALALGLTVSPASHADKSIAIAGWKDLVDNILKIKSNMKIIWETGTKTLGAMQDNVAEVQAVKNINTDINKSLGSSGGFTNAHNLRRDNGRMFTNHGVSTGFSSSGLSYVNPELGTSIRADEPTGAKASDFSKIRKQVDKAYYVPLDMEANRDIEKDEPRRKKLREAESRRSYAYRQSAISAHALAGTRKKSLPEMQKTVKETMNRAFDAKSLREDMVANTRMLSMVAELLLQNQELLASSLELNAFQAGVWHGIQDSSAAQFMKNLRR